MWTYYDKYLTCAQRSNNLEHVLMSYMDLLIAYLYYLPIIRHILKNIFGGEEAVLNFLYLSFVL